MSTYYATSFPNLADPRYAPEEGLFDAPVKSADYLDKCIKNFNRIVERHGFHQIPFFISKDDWKHILNPITKFPGAFPKGPEKLYAIAFCYCLGDGKPDSDFVYLRLRLIFAEPKPPVFKLGTTLLPLSRYPDLPARVYTSPIGRTKKVAAGSSAFEWLSDRDSVGRVGQDVIRWSGGFRDFAFPEIEFDLSKPPTINYYEGNIIGKQRLQYIFDQEVIKKKQKGITIQFAYDDLKKEIFLVFSINPNYTTFGSDDPLKCPPNPTNICGNNDA